MLAERVKQAIEHAGLNQADVARATGKSSAAANQWVKGETKSLKAETALKLARACGVTVEWLVLGPPHPMTTGEAKRPPVYVAAVLDQELVRAALAGVAEALAENPALSPSRQAQVFCELYSSAVLSARPLSGTAEQA